MFGGLGGGMFTVPKFCVNPEAGYNFRDGGRPQRDGGYSGEGGVDDGSTSTEASTAEDGATE
jgi:hypothetical protein